MKKKESFKMILLNEDNELIKVSDVSEGDKTSCEIDSRKMFKDILINDAKAIIICHNHCFKNLTPSQEDIIETRKIQGVCNYLDVRFLGHIIINLGGYYYMHPYKEE